MPAGTQHGNLPCWVPRRARALRDEADAMRTAFLGMVLLLPILPAARSGG